MELGLTLLIVLLGISLTAWAVVQHLPRLIVPGATLILVGGAWLGSALARHDLRLFPGTLPRQRADKAA